MSEIEVLNTSKLNPGKNSLGRINLDDTICNSPDLALPLFKGGQMYFIEWQIAVLFFYAINHVALT